jgi:hypothetical protein
MKKQIWVKNIAFTFLGMSSVIICLVFLFSLIRVPVYPNLTGHYSTDFGLKWYDCGDVSKFGFSIHKEGSYYSSDELESVKRWYKQFGWDDFIIKGHDLGIFNQSEQAIGELQITIWKRAQYLPGTLEILTDSDISFCLPR